MKAGSMAPQVIGDNGEKLVFDQSGRVSFSIRDTSNRGRLVRIPTGDEPGNMQVDTYSQWTCPDLDLSCQGIRLRLYFIGLPVALTGETWSFDHQGPGAADDVLRQFRWGTIGETTLAGLTFQVFQLKGVEFSETAGSVPGLPVRVVLQGVFHFKETTLCIADPDRQLVQVTMASQGDTWSVEDVQGKFLWPLYEAAPDFADATRDQLSDPLPWI
jgi:hypothetical protein